MRILISKFFNMFLNQRGSVGVVADPAPADPAPADPAPVEPGNPSPEQVLYGNIKVSWPEGIEDGLKSEASLKSFVSESGEINIANLAKSFVHTKKQMGMDKVVLPGENSTAEEIDEFWGKLGHQPDKEQYNIDKIEEGKLDDGFLGKLKDFAHENKMPVSMANKLAGFLNAETIVGETEEVTAKNDAIVAGLDSVKEEFGQAYDQKIGIAKRVLSEVIKDDAISKGFQDPAIGSNPAVIKALVKIGESLFKEDTFNGATNRNMFSPAEAQEQINTIMGDKNHAYHKPTHPSHDDAVKKMMKLFEMKS